MYKYAQQSEILNTPKVLKFLTSRIEKINRKLNQDIDTDIIEIAIDLENLTKGIEY